MRHGLVSVLIALTLAVPAAAHDMVSDQFIAGEQALSDAQEARDEVLSSPDATADTKQAAETFVSTAFTWNHTNLSVCFWQTDNTDLLKAVATQANLWTSGSKISFDFGDNDARQCTDGSSADIRVTFKVMPVESYAKVDRPLIAWNWSEYGNLASVLKAKISMSLIAAPQYFAFDLTPSLNFLVAHEFGHALGLIHEHQRVDCTPFLAEKKIVMDAYRFKKDSDYDAFIFNFKEIPLSDPALRPIAIGVFDANSVMMYNFPQKIWNPLLTNNPCARPVDVQHPNGHDIEAVNYLYGAPDRRADAQHVLEKAYEQHVKIADAAGLIASARGGVGEKEQKDAAARARANSAAAKSIRNLFGAIKQATSPDLP